MKKVLLLIAVFSAITLVANSQKDHKKGSINVGAQTSIGVGDLGDTHGFGLGANVLGLLPVGKNIDLTGRLSYTYLFGKKYSGVYDPGGGGGGSYDGRFKGMNDVGITGGARVNSTDGWFGGAEAGVCIESSDGESSAGVLFSLEGGFIFPCAMPQSLSAFLGICGDPLIQIGIRYSIRL